MLSAHQLVLVSWESPKRWEPGAPNGSLEKEERIGQQVRWWREWPMEVGITDSNRPPLCPLIKTKNTLDLPISTERHQSQIWRKPEGTKGQTGPTMGIMGLHVPSMCLLSQDVFASTNRQKIVIFGEQRCLLNLLTQPPSKSCHIVFFVITY